MALLESLVVAPASIYVADSVLDAFPSNDTAIADATDFTYLGDTIKPLEITFNPSIVNLYGARSHLPEDIVVEGADLIFDFELASANTKALEFYLLKATPTDADFVTSDIDPASWANLTQYKIIIESDYIDANGVSNNFRILIRRGFIVPSGSVKIGKSVLSSIPLQIITQYEGTDIISIEAPELDDSIVPAWSIETLTKLLWADASNLTHLFQDQARTIPVVTNGDTCKSIGSPDTDVLSHTTGASYTTFVQNSLAALDMSGYLDAESAYTYDDIGVALVYRTDTSVGLKGIVTMRDSANGDGWRLREDLSDKAELSTYGSTNDTITSTATMGSSQAQLIIFWVDPTEFLLRLNGTTEGQVSSDFSESTTNTDLRLGAYYVNSTGNGMTGYLCEMVVTSAQVMKDNLAEIESYLNSKWDVF